jgi:hypothetical protein
VTADAVFDLDNPFRASINLLRVVADAYYKGIYLGQINVPNVNPVIRANGGQKITSYPLPFTIATDPKFLISFLKTAAADQGVDLGILRKSHVLGEVCFSVADYDCRATFRLRSEPGQHRYQHHFTSQHRQRDLHSDR